MQKIMFYIAPFLFLITLSSAALSLTFVPPTSNTASQEVAVFSVMFLCAPILLGSLALSRQLAKNNSH